MGKGRGGGAGGRGGRSAFSRPDLLAMEEDVIRRGRRSEYSFSVSADGTRTEIIRGTPSRVPLAYFAYHPGATATHLHPGNYGREGGSMSDRDIAIALAYGMNLRAFGKWSSGAGGTGIWRAQVTWPNGYKGEMPTPGNVGPWKAVADRRVRPLESEIRQARKAWNDAHPIPPFDYSKAEQYRQAATRRRLAFLRAFAARYGARYEETR